MAHSQIITGLNCSKAQNWIWVRPARGSASAEFSRKGGTPPEKCACEGGVEREDEKVTKRRSRETFCPLKVQRLTSTVESDKANGLSLSIRGLQVGSPELPSAHGKLIS